MDGTGLPSDQPPEDAPSRASGRRALRILRTVLEGVAVLGIALAGVIALLLFFENRDASTAGHTGDDPPVRAATGPGAIAPRETSALLKAGNVELRYRDPAVRNALVRYAQREAGTDSSALRKAGLAIIVTRDPRAAPITAVAYRRAQPIASVRDPALQAFVEAWLGQPG